MVIEDDVGALTTVVQAGYAAFALKHPDLRVPRIKSLRMERHGPSFRTLDSCLQHHGFTVAGVERSLDYR